MNDVTRLASDRLASSGIAHGFLGRTGGISGGLYSSLNCGPGSGDAPESILENRKRAVASLDTDARLVTLYQIHSADALTIDKTFDTASRPKADAMATNIPGIALGILTADCAPVLLRDAKAGVIGAAHAGWNGAISGVTDSVIAKMEALGAKRENISAAIGPCISQTAYEVGPEFEERFRASRTDNARFFAPSDRQGYFRFDLEAYVAMRLTQAGIETVQPLASCTYAREPEFFSYRRTTHRKEQDYGRQISLIALKR